MAPPKQLFERRNIPEDWVILHAWRGSIAHGMYEPSNQPGSVDDRDTMAVVIPDNTYYYGLNEFGSRGTKEFMEGEWDIVVYELQKVMRLLEKGNPNVLSLLWLPDNLYIKRSEVGENLILNRDVFSGRHVYHSFAGYANAQLHKMEHGAFNGYMGEKRKGLVEKYGYDTKNAAHLIRLLRMAIEFLRDGRLIVDRGGYDATELLDIKHGSWSLEKVKREAERLFRRAEDAYDRSTLPPVPDHEVINELCTNYIYNHQVMMNR